MKDLTQQFLNKCDDKGRQSLIESNDDHLFNSQTKDIWQMAMSIIKLMSLQKQRYFKTSQLDESGLTEHQRDQYDIQVNTEISLCQAKIKELQQLLEQQEGILRSKNTTEYAHKEVVLNCLTTIMNKCILQFKEFKLHRQRQKERLSKLKNISTTLVKQEQQIPLKQKKNDENNEFMQENELIVKEYGQQIKEIITIQSQMMDIHETIKTMAVEIQKQDQTTELIMEHAKSAVQSLEGANKELIRASKYNEEFGFRWAVLFMVLAMILLFYDFLN